MSPFPPIWRAVPADVSAHLVGSLALSGAIGFALGVFGGGGSILAVPMLVFVTRVSPAAAAGMSLAMVGATSLTASYAHHRRGQVRLRIALLFGGAGIATAFLGARLSHLVSGRTLMLAFATLMVVVGGWMFVERRTAVVRDETKAVRPHLLSALLAGGVVGAITGFLGVGGGFLIVPALIAFAGLEMREAVGTSLLVIAINSAAGLLGHLGKEHFDLRLAAMLTALAVVGALSGERSARGTSLERLRRGFALFVIAVGLAVAGSTVFGSMSLR